MPSVPGFGAPPAPVLPADWPHREASHFVEAGGLRWHVQELHPALPAGPAAEAGAGAHAGCELESVLLIHGAGASTHSWRDLAPRLARHRRVLMVDLPGHAFTTRPPTDGLTLPGMAAGLGALMRALRLRPTHLVGHSAGAAVAARLVLDGLAAPRSLAALNGAWLPPAGQGRWFYGPLAKLLVLNPLVPHLFSLHAGDRRAVRRLIDSTGSTLGERGVALYAQLVSRPAHVSAVLAMMAAWDLAPLLRDLPALRVPLHLFVGEQDRTVPPAASLEAQRRVPAAQLERLPGLGHLAHEEAPERVATVLERVMALPA